MSTPPTQPPQVPTVSEPLPSTPAADDLSIGRNAGNKVLDYIILPGGKELSESAALDLAKSRPIQWIVLAGPSDSGKTTFLTSLYELFQWSKVEGYAFAGSNTLPAFEERCYLSRRQSGKKVPHTQRTPYKEFESFYLHLRVRSIEGLRPFRDILCTDVSGEMFEDARDSTDECKKMLFLKRASHFLLFLDSAKCIDRDKRWATVDDGQALLRSCIDSEMIGPRCAVNVVWSRFDYFDAEEAENEHVQFRANAERQLRETFNKALPKLMFSEVAARPLKQPKLRIGHGVPAILKQWLETPLEMKAVDLFPTAYSGTRESELFAARHFANEESSK
jgi:hypothetical protein